MGCKGICVLMQVFAFIVQFLCPLDDIFQPKSLLCHLHPLLYPPSIFPLISCLFLKPCGTRPVCPSQEVWGRMAASWHQTAPKLCMLALPPSDTPALQWSPLDCPENQKHLPCLNETQTDFDKDTHTYHHTNTIFMHNTHTHTQMCIQLQILKCKYSDTDTLNTHFYTLEYKNTGCASSHVPAAIDLFYQRRGVNSHEINCGYHICLQHSFYSFWEDNIQISTNRGTGKPAQTSMKRNMSCKRDHQTDHDDDKDDDHSWQ